MWHLLFSLTIFIYEVITYLTMGRIMYKWILSHKVRFFITPGQCHFIGFFLRILEHYAMSDTCMIDTGKFRSKVENTIVENPRVENPRFEQSGILRSGKNQEWKKPGWKIPVRSYTYVHRFKMVFTKVVCIFMTNMLCI